MYEAHAGPNMTPMVDVVMVILIFFMTSAAILGPEWFLATSLPPARERGTVAPVEPRTEDQRVVVRVELVAVDGGGGGGGGEGGGGEARARVDGGEPMALDAVRGVFEEALVRARTEGAADSGGREVVVLVLPGAGVAYEAVVRVHEHARLAGVDRIAIVPEAERGNER
jgi:biopolymer transport protein ExbD